MLDVAVAAPRTVAAASVESPPSKRLARVAGVLFIVATVADVIAAGLLDPLVGSSRYLAEISGHQDRVLIGVSLELLAAFACAGIGFALYPAVRRHDHALALGSAGFRIIEATLYVVVAIGTLLLLELAQQNARAGDPGTTYFKTTGALLQALGDDAAVAGILAFYLGAGLYYFAFYRSQLLPRWLSAWGLAGVALGAVAAFLVLFEATDMRSTLHVALNLPIALQEMVLAIWLIVRGFNPSRWAACRAG
jgi:uncharacterized protein DUF4386